MATTYANEVAGLGTTPTTKQDGGIQGGRLRRFRASFTMAAQASGDDIVLARVPAGYRFAFGIINAMWLESVCDIDHHGIDQSCDSLRKPDV